MKKYTKRVLSMLLAVAMLFSVGITAYAGDEVAQIGETPYESLAAAIENASSEGSTTITLLADVNGTGIDFESKNIVLDLNGYTLSGSVENAQNVSAAVLKNYNDDYNWDDDIESFRTLAATGVYKSVVYKDVDGYEYDLVADGFDKKAVEGGIEIFDTSTAEYFVVVTVTGTDRDTTTSDKLDVWANDTVTVSVSIVGGRAAAIDLTLKYNTDLFTATTDTSTLGGWGLDGSNGYRITTTGSRGSYFEAGAIIGTSFTFKANKIAESQVNDIDNLGWFNVFTVGGQTVRSIYVTKAYKDGTGEAAKGLIDEDHAINGKAYIIMQDGMSGSVEGATLTYNGTDQKLVKENTFSATDGSNNITDVSTIEYCIVNEEQANGVQEKQKTDSSGNPLYYEVGEGGTQTGTETTTPTSFPVPSSDGTGLPLYYEVGPEGHTEIKTTIITPYPVYTTEPTSPDATGLTYTSTVPTGNNAGTYYVFYKVSSNGYKSYYGKKEVTIAKQEVTLTWAAPTYNSGAAETAKWVASGSDSFYGPYDAVGFIAPTATYKDWKNDTQNATVNLKVGPNESELKGVGDYTFEVAENSNYTFSNPTCAVKVTGKEITGWELNGTEDQYNDGLDHTVATLSVAVDNPETEGVNEGASLPVTEPSLEITLEKSTDGVHWTPVGTYTSDTEGENPKTAYDKAVEAMPKEKDTGVYYTRVTVKADNYETKQLTAQFNLKTPIFYVETTEYVSGYTEILVYTSDDGVTFKYGDPTKPSEQVQMYDVSSFGYQYQGKSFTYVYALVIEGEYHDWIYASNEAAGSVRLPANTTEHPLDKADKLIYDVNGTGAVTVSQEDYTAAQAIYNCDATYLKNLDNMYIVLRADVNRDKKVNVEGDVSPIKDEYTTNWNS